MKAKKKIILQIGKNLCSLALVLIMMICIIPQMTVKADNVGTTEEKLEEDWGAMSSAAGKMNMTNTTTKAQVMKVITAAAKNGTKAEWKSFRKVDATYESKGGVTAYLNLSLDGKTRELYINEVIPTLGNNRPEKGIAVSEDEWNILRLTNIERAKEGKKLLTMPAALQKATAVRAKENVNNTQPAHTRPNGTSYKTAVPSSFKTTGLGENMYKCTKTVTAQLAMRGWMNSASHKANILRENYQYLGVGTYETEAVQIFASSNKKIKSYTTSTGKTTFADEEAMAGEYLICTDQAGVKFRMTHRVQKLAAYTEPKDACSACYGSLIYALDRLNDAGYLRRGLPSVAIGQGYQNQPDGCAKIGVGRCTKCCNKSLAGCPPKAADIVGFLKENWG